MNAQLEKGKGVKENGAITQQNNKMQHGKMGEKKTMKNRKLGRKIEREETEENIPKIIYRKEVRKLEIFFETNRQKLIREKMLLSTQSNKWLRFNTA